MHTPEIVPALLLLPFYQLVTCRDFNSLPAAQPLPNLTLKQLLLRPAQPGDASSSQLLNTCSSEALVEMLRHLKRAYWPWPWDTNIDCFDRGGVGSTGGFRWVGGCVGACVGVACRQPYSFSSCLGRC